MKKLSVETFALYEFQSFGTNKGRGFGRLVERIPQKSRYSNRAIDISVTFFLSLKDKNTLKVRGYSGVSLFGRTEYWTKSSS
ncbi:MAG: hypothetical protein C5B59_02320 [Bacteroidetes bacterium]|nr:MAG: hypothetical protein C5B59_02320 [Bacteroidota bacterium]